MKKIFKVLEFFWHFINFFRVTVAHERMSGVWGVKGQFVIIHSLNLFQVTVTSRFFLIDRVVILEDFFYLIYSLAPDTDRNVSEVQISWYPTKIFNLYGFQSRFRRSCSLQVGSLISFWISRLGMSKLWKAN